MCLSLGAFAPLVIRRVVHFWGLDGKDTTYRAKRQMGSCGGTDAICGCHLCGKFHEPKESSGISSAPNTRPRGRTLLTSLRRPTLCSLLFLKTVSSFS